MLVITTSKTGDSVQGFHDGTEIRILGRNPRSAAIWQHTITPFKEYLNKTGNPVVDLTTLAPFDYYQKNVPILDQMQTGSCVAHAHTTAFMKSRDRTGLVYIAFSPDGLYAYICGGSDNGSVPSDAVKALETTGLPLLSDQPDNFVTLNQLSAQAKANALNYLANPLGVYECKSFAELVTAEYLGFATTLTINVGNNFNNLSSEGVVPYTSGEANHCTAGGEAFKRLSDGTPAFRSRNSWDVTWPGSQWDGVCLPGTYWLTAQHIDNQPDVEMYAFQWVDDETGDANDIPDLAS